MVWTLAPSVFYFLLSIFVLALSFFIGWALYARFKQKLTKKTEGMLAFFLALGMAMFYLYVAETFTDRASYGEKIITNRSMETVTAQQVVIIPFSRYVVIERLYEFGYVQKEERNGEEYQLTFEIANGPLFLQTYHSFIVGKNWWSNEARFSFQQAYEQVWKEAALKEEELPGLEVRIQ